MGSQRRVQKFKSTYAVLTFSTLALWGASAQAQQQSPEYVPGEIIVKLKSKSKSMQAQAFIGKAVSEKSMSLKGTWSGLNMHHFALKPGQSVESIVAELKADPEVEYAEPNYILKRQSAGFEGEPMAMSDVRAAASSDYSAFAQTNAPIQASQAWSAASSSATPPVVAVIDTGLDINHDVFVQSGSVWTNPGEIPNNGIDDDRNGYVDDVHGWNFVSNSAAMVDDDGHGTHVSGIVLGATQDITAIPLEPAKIRIMPLKFLDGNGSGSTSDAVKAIYYAVNNGAKVLSNSWGGGGFSNSLLDAIAYAYEKKVVFVAAAGNASSNNDSAPTYPANYAVPNLISVAATTDLDGLASFSNYGSRTVHMGSPGSSIWSTYPNDLYGRASGTSMATPFVSGLAALMVREAPTMNGYQVKQLIFNASVPVSSLSSKTVTKARLNIYNGLMSAKGASVDPSQPEFNAASIRAPSSLADPGAGAIGGCGLVTKMALDASGGGPGGLSGPQKNLAFFALMIVLISPVLLSVAMRQRSGKNQRRYTRYQIDSSVRVKFGDRELVGQVSTISLGGVQLNTDAWLEKGGIVKMSIQSPDGRDQIEVEGKVVWSEEQKRYGVAFANANDTVMSAINRWSQTLLKA